MLHRFSARLLRGLASGAFALFCLSLSAQLSVQALRVENLENPIGLDAMPPRFGWQIAPEPARRGVMQTAYEIRVAANQRDLEAGKNLVWASGRVASDASAWVPFGGSAPLQAGKKYWWQVRVWDNAARQSAWSAAQFWQMGLLAPADWSAKWIALPAPEDSTRPSPMFRKAFSLSKKIASATAYITAHGLYEAEINGQRIGQNCLAPGWTAYQKRLQYQAYDVSALLRTGSNAIGITLGNGWWRGYIGFSGQKDFYGKDLAALVQLDIEFADGSRQIIGSDGSWRCSAEGPTRSAEIYHGETFDARRQMPGWSQPGFDDTAWSLAAEQDLPKNTLVGTENEPIRRHETFAPRRIFRTPKGELVADFGQNLVGWVVLRARGKSGDTIRLQFAEVLDKHGNFYTENLRAARNTDVFVLSGAAEKERFEPRFTFHGFQFAKIEGYPSGDLRPEDIEAVAIYSAMRPAGQFAASDSLINQLQHNIQWGQRGNFLDVPTDCPQRDERLGWTGDAQAFSRTAMFNFDAHNFFTKWLKDVAADQQPDGSVPWVVPNVLWATAGASTGWADVATILPWNLWLAYGDRRALGEQYPSMKAWVEFMRAKSRDDLWNTGFHFGDWLFYRPADDNDGKAAVTDKYLIAQCFYAHSTDLLVRAAEVLGKKDDAEAYGALLQKIKAAYLNEYVTPNGRLVSGTQTAMVLALQFDMLPESLREKTAKSLVENVKAYGTHLTTGFLGTPHLCHVLTRFGHDSLAYSLLNQKTYPSWLYPVTRGATTIWERWDGIKPDSTFQAVTMNSFNHYAYGAIGDWMYRRMAGLDADAPGYKTLRIEPRPGGGFRHAAADLQTLYGLAASHWRAGEAGDLTFEITVPPNTAATVVLPTADAGRIRESGKALPDMPDVRSTGLENGRVALKIGSGKYVFELREH